MLEIRNLHVKIADEDKTILNGHNLTVHDGEVAAIMGPNGSGKSTLSYVIAGKEDYEVLDGEILLDGQNILEMEADARAAVGLFLAFQYPLESPGVATMTFLKAAMNAQRRTRGEDELQPAVFIKAVNAAADQLAISKDMLKRALNVGVSGGEKKRMEILQMALLQPKMCILDETDSGLDIDALKVVSEGVNRLRAKDRSFLVITHYQRLLDHIVPDTVHVMARGQIVKSGGKELALELEKNGYRDYASAA
jgi:Fe-S cluster assembly ATP-binding protein